MIKLLLIIGVLILLCAISNAIFDKKNEEYPKDKYLTVEFRFEDKDETVRYIYHIPRSNISYCKNHKEVMKYISNAIAEDIRMNENND